MKTVDFPNLGKTLTHDTWQEQLAHSLCIMIDDMSLESMQVMVGEDTDIEALETDCQDFLTYFKSWLGSALQSSVSGESIAGFDASYLPDIALMVTLILTGQWGAVFVLFVKTGLEAVIDFGEKKLNPDMETGDLIDFLKKVLAVLDSEGNIVGSKVDGLSNLHITINTALQELEERYTVLPDTP